MPREIDDDRYLDQLLDEALLDLESNESREFPTFTHAFVNASLTEVVGTIRQIKLQSLPEAGCRVFGACASFHRARLFLSPCEKGCLIWLPQINLALAAAIADGLQRPVHWMSVYEAYSYRAYVRFERAQCIREVLDPESYWTKNLMYGEDLVGKGVRKFESFDDFADDVRDEYLAKDQTLDYERISRAIDSGTTAFSDFEKLLQLDLELGAVAKRFLGVWNERDRDEVARVLD